MFSNCIWTLSLGKSLERTDNTLSFFTDASTAKNLGFGCYYNKRWSFGQWENFIEQEDPSIAYLELYALCAGILIWEKELTNMRIVIFCNNESVIHMVSNSSSKCKNCMYLLRLLTLNNMLYNRRITVRYIASKENRYADFLSRLKIRQFLEIAPEGIKQSPEPLPTQIWPLSRIRQR